MSKDFIIDNITVTTGDFTQSGGIPSRNKFVITFDTAFSSSDLYTLALLFALSEAEFLICTDKVLETMFPPGTVQRLKVAFNVNIMVSGQLFHMIVYKKICRPLIASEVNLRLACTTLVII